LKRLLLRGLGPNVVALGLASLFTDVAAEMVFPLMPFFITGTLKASQAWVGLVEGAADSLSSLLRIASGWLSDRSRRRKPFIFWGYGVSVAARPLFAFATLPLHVLAIRLVDRFGKGFRLAARDALLADSCAPEVRGKAFGLQRAMDHLGAALGPILAWLLVRRGVDVRDIFLLTAIPAAFVLLVIGGLVRDIPASSPPRDIRLSLAPFDARFRWFLAAATVFTLGNASDAFILLRAAECGIPQMWVPLVWCGHSLLRALASVPAGVLADRFGKRRMVLGGWLVFAASYAAFGAISTPGPFFALAASYALHHAMAESVQRAVVADLVPEHLRGTAYGLYWFCAGLAALPASLGFGLIWKRWGAGPAFWASAGMAVVACAMLVAMRGDGGKGGRKVEIGRGK
jgi:MFS family permease